MVSACFVRHQTGFKATAHKEDRLGIPRRWFLLLGLALGLGDFSRRLWLGGGIRVSVLWGSRRGGMLTMLRGFVGWVRRRRWRTMVWRWMRMMVLPTNPGVRRR